MSNESNQFNSVESAWGIKLPSRFLELYDHDGWHMIALPNGQEFQCPMSLMLCSEIVSAKGTADDWQIAPGLVPFMGDFHDLICLDYRSGVEPSVTMIDDARNERAIFESIDGFLDAPKVEKNDEKRSLSGVKKTSYLNI